MVDVVKLAPRVRPARSFVDMAALVEVAESGIAIGLQGPAKISKVFPGMLAPAVGKVAEEDRRGYIAACGTIIPHIGPESAGG